jgi:negative regulator of flagellin synthesis FlgM
MADRITGYGRPGLDIGATRQRPVAQSGRQPAQGAAPAHEARDVVELTPTAAQLKAIEARLAALPDVDRARVEALRQRIEAGEYRPDPARIAAKLLAMERDLG